MSDKEKAEKKPAAPAPVAPEPQAESTGETKRRKISRMTSKEVEQELKGVKEKMGHYQSDFARHLLARQKELSGKK